MPDPNPGMRDGLIRLFELRMQDLADDLTTGRISLSEWQTAMQADIREINALAVIAATGGDASAISPQIRMQLGLEMQKQYDYLNQFAGQIYNGDLTTAQISARAALYTRSSQAMYWKQITSEADLPAQPGDGSTACHSNCGCSWVSQDDGWHWQRGKVDSCEDCIQRENDWNPYQEAA